MGLLAVLLLVATFAPVLAPYSPREQLDPLGAGARPPGTTLVAVRLKVGGAERWLLADRVQRVDNELIVEQRHRTQRIAVESVVNLTQDGVRDRRVFLLGTDKFGRDLLSRMIYGARISLLVGCLAAGLGLSLGVLVGGLAAVGGPWVDMVLMRIVDALLSFPRIFLILALALAFQPGTMVVILILGGTGWMGLSRLVRAEILSLKQQDFVMAVEALGQHPLRILALHLLPNVLTPILVDTTLRIVDTILAEATLSFLGLGVQPPTPSWGNMIADGRDFTNWWVSAFPGTAIVVTVIAFNLLGDGLRDLLDPRLARRLGRET